MPPWAARPLYDQRMVKVIAVIRPVASETIEAEADSYEAAKAKIEAMVPEGYELLSVRSAK